jgi:hypothetical protein
MEELKNVNDKSHRKLCKTFHTNLTLFHKVILSDVIRDKKLGHKDLGRVNSETLKNQNWQGDFNKI